MFGHRCLGKVGGLGGRYVCAREKEAHGGAAPWCVQGRGRRSLLDSVPCAPGQPAVTEHCVTGPLGWESVPWRCLWRVGVMCRAEMTHG